MSTIFYEDQEIDISHFVEDLWESFIESSEEDWNGSGIVEHFDAETLKLLEDF